MSNEDPRFGGIQRLFGAAGFQRLRSAHVCVIGVGGVGSWTVEALARSGIGALTLVDFDEVCISNVNRQLHAVEGEFGKPKIEALARRIRAINPACVVRPQLAFFTPKTADEISAPRYDCVVDAIDDPRNKALLIARCRAAGVPIVTVGGAGGRRDPTAIEVADLARTSHDRLLQEVRKLLRKEHGFPRDDQPFGVEAVFSREAPVFPQSNRSVCAAREPGMDLRLDCRSGFGTASFVTGAFGFAAAARVVQALAGAGGGVAPATPPNSR